MKACGGWEGNERIDRYLIVSDNMQTKVKANKLLDEIETFVSQRVGPLLVLLLKLGPFFCPQDLSVHRTGRCKSFDPLKHELQLATIFLLSHTRKSVPHQVKLG